MFAGLLEPVLPGSVTFESSILAPLRNSYLYEESKESFTYNSAQLINNAALQQRVSRHVNFSFCSVCHQSSLIAQFFRTNLSRLIFVCVCVSRFSQYSAFRAEKRENGYSEEELKESFGFLLLDDKSRVYSRNTEYHHGPVFKSS